MEQFKIIQAELRSRKLLLVARRAMQIQQRNKIKPYSMKPSLIGGAALDVYYPTAKGGAALDVYYPTN